MRVVSIWQGSRSSNSSVHQVHNHNHDTTRHDTTICETILLPSMLIDETPVSFSTCLMRPPFLPIAMPESKGALIGWVKRVC